MKAKKAGFTTVCCSRVSTHAKPNN